MTTGPIENPIQNPEWFMPLAPQTADEWALRYGTTNLVIAELKESLRMDGYLRGDGTYDLSRRSIYYHATLFGFACCDWALVHGVPIPAVLEFTPSLAGAETDGDHYQSLDHLVTGEDLIFPGVGEDRMKRDMARFLPVLDRLLDWLNAEASRQN